MKRSLILLGLLAAASTVTITQVLAQGGSQAEAQRAAAAARTAQLAIEAKAPKLAFSEEVLPLRMANHTLGETEGVARNKAGHLFVYTRTGWSGSSRGGNAAKLFEFDQNNKFVKEWLPDSYGSSFAHAVRVDPEQNVWVVDEGSNTVVKVDPTGLVKMVLGRKPGVLLRGHGIALTDASLRSLVVRAYNLRMNARIEQQAIALGGKVTYLDDPQDAPAPAGAYNRGWEYWKQIVPTN